jgi:FkbM family methyltransferase
MGATGGPFVSHAQNLEDVVLWRVLQSVERGCYVDVGAMDPVVDSISWPFYEQGWRGLLIEPVPSWADALRRRRPHDITIEAAAGATAGIAPLFASTTTGNSSLVREVAHTIGADGVEFSETTTRVATLNDLLEEAGFGGRTIHFCTIDVEGSEMDVLAGFDLARWRPWILVVEATQPNRRRPSHAAWEHRVLEAGYQFCLFDGLNRFYVHPGKADEFGERLSYPACAFDDPFCRALSDAHRAEELERIASEAICRTEKLEQIASRVAQIESVNATLAERAAQVEREKAVLVARNSDAAAQLSAMKATVSWRVTRPLRALRAQEIRLSSSLRNAAGEIDPVLGDAHGRSSAAGTTVRRDRGALDRAFARRATQAAELLIPGGWGASSGEASEALTSLQEALTQSAAPDRAKAWLALVAADGTFPGERSVERIARLLRMEGASGVRRELLDRFAQSVEHGLASTGELDIRCNQVIVDVTHTTNANDLHTGIQRVVRETVACWIDSGRPMDLIRFDLQPPAARLLSAEASERFRSWRTHVGSTAAGPYSGPNTASANTLVPWQCDLVVPELPFESERTGAYRGLGSASVLRSLSMVGYDVIPIVAAEKVVPEVTTDFGGYLSVLKHADRVSAISRTSKDSFEAFATMAAAEGLRPPRIEAHELPAQPLELDSGRLDAARSELGVGAGPVVLVVGSHEPRKNHLAVLEAAERLWARGDRAFELLFLGWSSWLSGEFDELLGKLVTAGRPIVVRKRCAEEELWAAYRFSRFSVFPSLLEGFGLPIAESLASGTPVITSNYGSMAEVADRGGCMLVDPRNVDALERAMAILLDDDDALGKLRDEALRVDTGTWENYAGQLWDFLTEKAAREQHQSAR